MMICVCSLFAFDVQRYPADKAYYIAKELLMTERTYKKDLEVITVVRALLTSVTTIRTMSPTIVAKV